jgi:hypothetical protein
MSGPVASTFGGLRLGCGGGPRDLPWYGHLRRVPLHPFLFAAYGVLYLYSQNLEEVLPVDVVAPVARGLLIALVATAILAVMYLGVRRGAIVATAIVAVYYGYGHVAEGLGDAGLGQRERLALAALVIGAAGLYALKAKESLPRVTSGLNIVALVLIAVVGSTIVPYEIQRAGREPIALASATTAQATGGRRPDIYFLIFDRYGSADSIERRFGLTDNEIYGWLRDRGFHVPANSHANYRATDFSLAATLNMQFLDNLTEDVGRTSGDRTPAHAMIANNAVGRFLKSQGYRYYQLGTWFAPTHNVTIADENLTVDSTSEFESVLNDTTILPTIERKLGAKDAKLTFFDRHREGTLFELRQLRRVSTAPSPKFVFAHILLPHDPYVFRADGSFLTEAQADATDERDAYAGQLVFANRQIKDIVGYLLSGPEESRPIVIMEGDEGPLACREVDCVGTSEDYLRIRLGNLVAMYLPGVDVELSDTFTSVNTFRTVFREYFGADLPNLPDRSFTWPDNDHIYDFRDVTELVTAP